MEKKKINCSLSKYGLPTLTENGGGSTNTGSAVIIASSKGSKKKPIYIPTKGDLSNRDHAFFVVKEGDKYVEVNHQNHDFTINVYEIETINVNEKEVTLKLLESYSEDNFLEYSHSTFKEAIKHGINKSTTYHCRFPFFYYADQKLIDKVGFAPVL